MEYDFSQSQGILLELGCGETKQEGFVGIDVRDLEGVDIVHDLESFPWPVHDEICLTIIASHLIEHIKPWFSIDFMNEVWRILKVGRDAAFSTPYAGSPGFWQDPTHCNGWTQATWQYFDPRYPLYRIYKPKPFLIKRGFPVWQIAGNMECVLTKIPEEKAEHYMKVGFEPEKDPPPEPAPPEEKKGGKDLSISVHEDIKISEALK